MAAEEAGCPLTHTNFIHKDAHTPQSYTRQKEERTWASLFVDACKYAWPDAWNLRLRVFGCVLLLISMRFLNLAVPIFYKVRLGLQQ